MNNVVLSASMSLVMHEMICWKNTPTLAGVLFVCALSEGVCGVFELPSGLNTDNLLHKI
jgi:hypothetical protein